VNLTGKMTHGALWSFVEKGGQQLSSLLVFSIVARLIGPEEYGLVSLCYIYLAVTTPITSSLLDGIVSLRIRDDRKLSTLFWLVCGAGLCLSAAGALLAYPIASLMAMPRLGNLLLCFSILPLPLAFSALPTTLVYATLDFRSLALRTLFSTVASGFIGIIAAVKGAGAYALILQQLAQYIITNIIIWRLCDWRPQMIFDRTLIKETVGPGIKYMASNFIVAAEVHAPRFIIGSLLGPIAVGYYAFVTRVALAIQEVVFSPLASVIHPALATIPDDKVEQKRILDQLISMTGFLGLPALGGAAAIAPVFIPLFFGAEWSPCVELFQVYVMGTICWLFIVLHQEHFRSQNMMGIYTLVQFALLCIWLVIVYILSRSTLMSVGLGSTAVAAVSLCAYIGLAKEKMGLNFWHSYQKVLPSLIATALMAASLFYIREIGLHVLPLVQLAILVPTGIAIYCCVMLITQRQRMMELLRMIRRKHVSQNPMD